MTRTDSVKTADEMVLEDDADGTAGRAGRSVKGTGARPLVVETVVAMVPVVEDVVVVEDDDEDDVVVRVVAADEEADAVADAPATGVLKTVKASGDDEDASALR